MDWREAMYLFAFEVVTHHHGQRLYGILCSGAFSYANGKRSSNMIASWLFTACHSRTDRFHSAEVAFSARLINFAAASSLRK